MKHIDGPGGIHYNKYKNDRRFSDEGGEYTAEGGQDEDSGTGYRGQLYQIRTDG